MKNKRLISHYLIILIILSAFACAFTGSSVSAAPALKAPKIKSVKVSKQGEVIVTWKRVSGASGYEISRSEKKKSGFSSIGNVSSGSAQSYKDKNIVPGSTYNYKVRAWQKKNGKKKWSSYSQVVSVKIPVTVKKNTQEEFASALSEINKKYTPSGGRTASSDPYASGRLVVKGKNGQLSFEKYDPIAVVQSKDNYYILQFSSASAAKKASKKIQTLPSVVYVEPDAVCVVKGFSNGAPVSEVPVSSRSSVNPKTAKEFVNTSALSWGAETVRSYQYASTLSGLSGTVKVAVVDTGVGYHTFINDRVISGKDFVDNDDDPRNDSNSHGTHVAGIIVDNTPGLDVKIMPVRVLGSDGGYDTDVASGIRYAADNGAKVINLSLGGSHSNLLEDAIAYAVRKGAVVVAAAGNESQDTSNVCPAHCENTITVSATNSFDSIAYFSNYGEEMEVAAPGVYIYSTIPNNLYQEKSGTSMATPFVSAAAAMYWLDNPTANNVYIMNLIKKHVQDLGSTGWDKEYGYGRLQLPTSRNDDVPVTDVTLNQTSLSLTVNETGQLTATVAPAYATDKTITWSSSNSSVASVSSVGTISAKKAGSAIIYVKTSNDIEASCKVTVKKASSNTPKGKTITLKKASLILRENTVKKKSYTLKKKGTFTIKAKTGFLRFVAPKAGTYSFTFSNMRTVGVSGYDWNIGYVSFLDKNAHYMSSSRVKINGAKTNTAYLSTKDGKTVHYPAKESWLPTRTAKVRLKKGEAMYLMMNIDNLGKYSTLTLKIK